MKYIISFCGVMAALGWAFPAASHHVELLSFNKSSGGFQLIIPRLVDLQPDGMEAGIKPSLSSELDEGFASWAIGAPPATATAFEEARSVPLWMRSYRSASRALAVRATPIELRYCAEDRYAPHPALTAVQEARRLRYYPQMVAAACNAGIPVELFDALIIQESRYNPFAVSAKGASGLTQLMPGTARMLGVLDRWSVAQNLEGGARYLRKQLDSFGSWAYALGAYNSGPANVLKYRGVPPFAETREYVRTILANIGSSHQYRNSVRVSLTSERHVNLASFAPSFKRSIER